MCKSPSDGSIEILGMKTVFPSPPKILHSNTRELILSKIMRVPLQRPLEGSRFLRSMRGHPGSRASLAIGKDVCIEIINIIIFAREQSAVFKIGIWFWTLCNFRIYGIHERINRVSTAHFWIQGDGAIRV